MKKLFKVVTLSVIILLLLAPCLDVNAGKKGVAGPGGCPQSLDLPFLYNVLGVDWAYTWAYCFWPMPSIEYVPMVRSIHGFDTEDVQRTITYYGTGIYWLVGNEPDNQWQDNLTPMEAAEAYGEIINTILEVDPTAKIILGNFSHPSQYFRDTWFAQFKSAWITTWNEDVTTNIVGYGVHAYAHRYSSETQQNAIDRVQRQVLAWKETNPDCELWVTEYGNLWETDIETMRQMTDWLEVNVDRYAYFYFGDEAGDWDCTSLYTEPWPLPMLTELGEAFINLPITTPAPAPTLVSTCTIVAPIPSPTRPRPTNTITSAATKVPTLSISLTPTSVLIPTPPVNPNMPDTMLGVAQEQLRVTWRLEKLLYAVSVIVTGGIAYVVKIMQEINSKS